jgi:hypothetical protein
MVDERVALEIGAVVEVVENVLNHGTEFVRRQHGSFTRMACQVDDRFMA